MTAREPKWIPRLSFRLLRLVQDGKLKPLDVIVYLDQVVRLNWTPREADICERYHIGSHHTYIAMMQRLRAAELVTSGGKDETGSRNRPPVFTRAGLWTAEAKTAKAAEPFAPPAFQPTAPAKVRNSYGGWDCAACGSANCVTVIGTRGHSCTAATTAA